MGVDYRFYAEPEDCAAFELNWFDRPCNEKETDIKPSATMLKSFAYDWNDEVNTRHTLTFDFHENELGFIVDTTVRFGSTVMDTYLTFVVNTLLKSCDVYVGGDCNFFSEDVEYVRERRDCGRWIKKGEQIRSLHNLIYGLKEGDEHAL